LALALVVVWLVIGAGEPGAALIVAALALPLLATAIDPAAIALPGLAPVLGIAGLAPVYPALAGLTRGAAGRALLGGIGYLWLAACEEVTQRTLLLGPDTVPPVGWEQSAATALGDVVAPLFELSVLAAAGIWAIAALVLPILVRGRAPVLDAIGALVWAAGLISALRLVGGGSSPPGLLFAALLAAAVAAAASRRLATARPPSSGAKGEARSDLLSAAASGRAW
jgi:hypothetical protein